MLLNSLQGHEQLNFEHIELLEQLKHLYQRGAREFGRTEVWAERCCQKKKSESVILPQPASWFVNSQGNKDCMSTWSTTTLRFSSKMNSQGLTQVAMTRLETTIKLTLTTGGSFPGEKFLRLNLGRLCGTGQNQFWVRGRRRQSDHFQGKSIFYRYLPENATNLPVLLCP